MATHVTLQCFDSSGKIHYVHVPHSADGADLRICDLRRALKAFLGERYTGPVYDIAIAMRVGRFDAAAPLRSESGMTVLDRRALYDFRTAVPLLETEVNTTMASQVEVPFPVLRRCRCRFVAPNNNKITDTTTLEQKLEKVIADRKAVAPLPAEFVVSGFHSEPEDKAEEEDEQHEGTHEQFDRTQSSKFCELTAVAARELLFAASKRLLHPRKCTNQAEFWTVELRALHRFIYAGTTRALRRDASSLRLRGAPL